MALSKYLEQTHLIAESSRYFEESQEHTHIDFSAFYLSKYSDKEFSDTSSKSEMTKT